MLRRIAIFLALFAIGCGSEPASISVAPPPPPVLIHLPGIGGELSIDHHLVNGLRDGGVSKSIEIIDWTESDRGPRALGNVARHKEWAQRVAERIEAIYYADPRTPIILVGHSGGTGIAVWALEDLPPQVHVRTLLLLASALSPRYDLTVALRHVSGHAFSLYSDRDDAILGTGTSVFGTVDRVKGPAAGYIGFHTPPHGQTKEYDKLIQLPYDPAWARFGNPGDHIGPTDRRFANAVLAPLINRDAPIVSAAAPVSDPAASR